MALAAVAVEVSTTLVAVVELVVSELTQPPSQMVVQV
jgi:hypothetical protein